jgi:hypothetical protein
LTKKDGELFEESRCVTCWIEFILALVIGLVCSYLIGVFEAKHGG